MGLAIYIYGFFFFNSGSTASKIQSVAEDDAAVIAFFSNLRASATATTLGGKASLQPKRTPVSSEEIEAVLVSDYYGFFLAAILSTRA